MSEFGIKLRELRTGLGWSQVEFANYIGMSKAFYNRIEVGLAKCPTSKINDIVKLMKDNNTNVSEWEEYAKELAQEKIGLHDIRFEQQIMLLKLSKLALTDSQIREILKLV